MEKPDLKLRLLEFYKKNSSNKYFLSREEILKTSKRSKLLFYFVDVFSHQSDYVLMKEMVNHYSEDILFGFKSGLMVCKDRVVDVVEEVYFEFKEKDYWELVKLHSMSFVRGTLKKEKSYHIILDGIIKTYKNDLKNYNKHIKSEKTKAFKSQKEEILAALDKDKNGTIDIIEGQDDFMTLFKKHQKKIVEVDKLYIQHFVKISNHLKTKRENLQTIFSTLNDSKDQSELEEMIGILKNQIHSYELILFHSLNMIAAIVDDDLITFYEIYESFDKLNMFNSNWENEVSQKLTNIGNGINSLMYSIQRMEINIVNGLKNLSYVTQQSFTQLNQSVTRELNSINSSVKMNNLLTGIQTYQMYKVNKNTKSLGS